MVGATLGPGGMSVVIERQEENMPPIITKDGVTVFRSLGFEDSSAHVLMESARDAAIRTASEAGDGTTTATILAEAFVRYTQEFCNKNKHMSPQRVMRIMQKVLDEVLLPKIDSLSVHPEFGTPEGNKILHSVAKISANGDTDLADAVMKCFDIIGDAGNVTIIENSGPTGYQVQKIEGYPVPVGFEDCCGPYYQKFINDIETQSSVLENPVFVIYYGRATDVNATDPILLRIAEAVDSGETIDGHKITPNVVFVATGFSEQVILSFATNFSMKMGINVFPLTAPLSPVKTGQMDFLMDIAAMTGATILDPMERPLQNFQLSDLGIGPRGFEASRFRSNIIGYRDELLVFERVDQIQKQLTEVAASQLDKTLLRERVAKLTSGIAKLVVTGSSHGEVKERRDRAEDAVCAVRGAIKYGALPGGGATLKTLAVAIYALDENEYLGVDREIVSKALLEPIRRLYSNAGYTPEEIDAMIFRLNFDNTYDVLENKFVNPLESGVLDSTPAVREALRNSMSIASLLGTCGGTIVFSRDTELERSEAKSTAEFLRNANVNEADLRP